MMSSTNKLLSKYEKAITDLDVANKKAQADNPVYKIRAFAPHTFHRFNFQTDLCSPEDGWKFFDSQQEFRFGSIASRYLSEGLSLTERDLLESICLKFARI